MNKECNKKIAAIVQARMGSTRLPGKTMADICGKPLLEHVIERVKHSKLISEIIVATTDKKKDDKIVELCKKLGIKCYKGSENNVLDRYYQCVKEFRADIIVRITADNPFVDPEVTDKIIKVFLGDGNFDYVSNTVKPTYPEGINAEVFTFSALAKAWKEAKKPTDKEHVTPYMWNNPEVFKIQNIENDIDLSYMRWTLDTKEDMNFIKEIYKRLYKPGKIFLMRDILDVLKKEPRLAEINSGIERFASLKEARTIGDCDETNRKHKS
jgi:spore coat polysaccharide biosynthesis protein SpsF